MALMYSVLHGDPKEKFAAIFEQVKGLIPGGRQDEVMGILENEETQNSMKEILDLVMNTRLASLIGDMMQSIKFEDLDINLEDPDELIRLMQNPQDSDALKVIMQRAQEVLKELVESGKINQQELIREIEMLRAKMTSSFGKYMNEMVVGRDQPATGNTSRQILSNSPEARRARMMARLQRKLGEKSRK
jgi:polyhydroxyalkanoate synthesis regulator phasin